MYEETLEPKPKKDNYRLALLAGIVFLVLWTFLSIKPVKVFLSWEKTTWTIVWVTPHERTNDDWGTYYTYTPTIQYTCGWEKVTSETRSSSSTKYKVWRSITAFCDPQEPKTLFISSDFLILIMPTIALLVLFIFWHHAISNRRQKEKQPSLSGDLISLVGLSFGLLLFSVVLVYLIYSIINGEASGNTMIGIIFVGLAVRLLRRGVMVKLKEYLRIHNAKSKIERWSMVIIQATIIWFQHTATLLDKNYYQILCSDWTTKYDSEEIQWQVSLFDDMLLKYLEVLGIIYDPKNPQKTLEELDANPKGTTLNIWYDKVSERLAQQIAAWENYEYPYWTFNGKKLTVWDSINVYIDPNNRKSYLVDLSFLK